MTTKKSSKKVAVIRAPRPIDKVTGYREGSLGFKIGKAYLGEKFHEQAVEAVEAVIKSAAKAKGKPTSEDYVHGRAISWVGFLKARDGKIYKDLPKKAEHKAEATTNA